MIVKIMNKDLNLSLLNEQLRAVGLGEHGLLLAGFKRVRKQEYEPFAGRSVIATSTTGPDDKADPGELRFKYDPALTSVEEATLDAILAEHVATDRSREQTNAQKDIDDAQVLADNYRSWDTLTSVQKDASNKVLTRLVARLENRQISI